MDIVLRKDEKPVFLLASCTGDEETGGGLVFFDGTNWCGIDRISTTGLFCDGPSLTRVLWVPSQLGSDTAILRYDCDGLRTFTLVNGLSDPHDVTWNGSEYICVSSINDSILWVNPSGAITRRFQPAPGGDCWHLNSLFPTGDKLFVSAFGRFERSREWVDHKMDGSGIVFDLETGDDVLNGLYCPHNPRQIDGGWLVCNSSRSELLFVDPAGVREAVQLENWTRGVAVTDSYIFVGESASRAIVNRSSGTGAQTATVAVICRSTHRILDRLTLPYREIHDLTLVNDTVLRGLLRAPDPAGIWVPPQFPCSNRPPGNGRGFIFVGAARAAAKIPSFELQLLAVREGVGQSEAVVSWVPGPALLQAAEGTQLHLSYHVSDPADGRVIVFDGPRAVPGLGPDGKLSVLPLNLPPEPGRYHVQIEPVVELRFWASDRGYAPLLLAAERKTDGSLCVLCTETKRQFVVHAGAPVTFKIDSPLYGLGDSERCIEIPWVLSSFRGEGRVLDIGYANAEPRYLRARNALNIPFLVGLDLAARSQPGICGVAGDVLSLPFRPGVFDLIWAISAIEHIGRDNSIYSESNQVWSERGDLDAAAALASLLRPGGRLLATLPFGRLEDHGWFVQYDLKRVQALLETTGCALTKAEYYAYGPYGWGGPADPITLGDIPYRTYAHAAGAVVCLELTRREIPVATDVEIPQVLAAK